MLTTDPIYYKPLQPFISINNTANNTNLYTYQAVTGIATGSGLTNVFPLYCSVSLSQNTHGQFTIQFEDQNKVMESVVTVGSRAVIYSGKSSTSQFRIINGLVRKKGYSRGADNKVLYTIQGSSTGIRLNERLTYIVSEAARLPSGQIDLTDLSRKADTLLASGLSGLTADGILSIANLAANSDVETFIASTNIQYGELQDLVNYYEDQSGGEVVVDTNDVVSFRYEIKNNLFGRGFTIKNNNDNKANDDADDTMYLVNKNWTYEDDFYKSSNYANVIYALLGSETDPVIDDTGFGAGSNYYSNYGGFPDSTHVKEIAVKFRPTHSHFMPADITIGISFVMGDNADNFSYNPRFRICKDSAGLPLNSGGIVANIDFIHMPTGDGFNSLISNEQIFYNSGGSRIDSFDLDTTDDYWFIMSSVGSQQSPATLQGLLWYASNVNAKTVASAARGTTTNTNGGSGWTNLGLMAQPIFEMPRRRSHSFSMYDPKAMQAISSGLTAGQRTDALLTDASSQIQTSDSMYRFLQQQIYNLARPRTTYNFPAVTAPNTPLFPGDPIIISDDILGFSTSGNQVVLTTCGDMSYQWGAMGSGNYEAPTNLSINAIGVHARYR